MVDDDGEGEAAPDGVGEHHHIGDDAAVLDTPEGAGAADARAHLVGDERDGPGGGDVTDPAQPTVGRGQHAALVLHRFDDESGVARGPGNPLVEDGLGPTDRQPLAGRAADAERAAVVLGIGQPGHPEALHVVGQSGRADGQPVAGAAEGEQPVPAGRRADEGEGGAHGVGGGRSAEPDPAVLRQPARQCREQLLGESVLHRRGQVGSLQRGAGVEHGADGLEHDRMVVAERERAGAGEAVQITATVGALDGQTTGAHRDNGQRAGVRTGRGLAGRVSPEDALVARR